MLKRLNRRDLAFGGLMMLLALFALWVSRNYEMGTLDQMSTGYMPWLISVSLLFVGAVIAVKALWTGPAIELEPHRWLRPREPNRRRPQAGMRRDAASSWG